jgi:hypothetical protein
MYQKHLDLMTELGSSGTTLTKENQDKIRYILVNASKYFEELVMTSHMFEWDTRDYQKTLDQFAQLSKKYDNLMTRAISINL